MDSSEGAESVGATVPETVMSDKGPMQKIIRKERITTNVIGRMRVDSLLFMYLKKVDAHSTYMYYT
jgi:hypothetical protein